MQTGPKNPYLADSSNAIGHGRCDQQDSYAATGPSGPTEVLSDDDVQFTWLGPGHFGGSFSSPYPDGKRVIWSNGLQTIVKLDYDTLEVLASHTVAGQEVTPMEVFEEAVHGLDTLTGQEAIDHSLHLTLSYMLGLDGVYKMLDRDNRLLVGYSDRVVAYADAEAGDRHSPIVEDAVWTKPDHIEGSFVGINMTFDGRVVVSTDHGWLIALTSDFSEYDAIQLPGAADDAADHWRRMEEAGKRGYGWVRTSLCTGDDGGIYRLQNPDGTGNGTYWESLIGDLAVTEVSHAVVLEKTFSGVLACTEESERHAFATLPLDKLLVTREAAHHMHAAGSAHAVGLG